MGLQTVETRQLCGGPAAAGQVRPEAGTVLVLLARAALGLYCFPGVSMFAGKLLTVIHGGFSTLG